MKSGKLMCVTTTALLAALAVPAMLAAHDNKDHNKKHHYKLIDLGTFGGPQSFTQDELKVLNSRGMVAGFADTSTTDPNYPNSCFFCGPYIDHAFQWQNGSVTDLGALPGLNTSAAFGISDSGLSAGFSENGETDPLLGIPEVHAVRWKDGQIIDLGTLEGGHESAAFNVNSRGQVAGISLNLVPDDFSGLGTQVRTFLWDKDNGIQDLGTLGTGTDAGILGFKGNVEINERGQVAACSFTNSTINPLTGTPTLEPFLWKNGKMLDLGTLGGTSGCAINLNNRAQVVGYSNVAGDLTFHPFLWTGARGMQDIGTLGGSFGFAIWANERREVVGSTTIQGDQAFHGFLWKDGVITDLGILNPLPYSFAEWINSREQIVGKATSSDFSTQVAVLWENGGPIVDLNTLVPPGSNLQLTEARNINDRGEISGGGVTSSGDGHAFLLIPCDEHHPGVEGCDYNRVAAPAVPQTSPALRNASSRTLPQSLMRRMNRNRFPGPALGPRN